MLIVGAGLSGIGAAYYLQARLPTKSFAVLESRGSIGGTWDLFRYPGVRSDSDLFTFSYAFKPWTSATSIADGHTILDYIRETAAENGLEHRIRTHHKVIRANWLTGGARWYVEIERTDSGQRIQMSCQWLFCAGGYYDHDEGYVPQFAGRHRYRGTILHPQHWPEDFEHRGKRIVVIGSGATAVTLVPALADTAAHVTMLQRSPTYIMPVPSVDPVTRVLHTLLGARRAFPLIRCKNIAQQHVSWWLCRKVPTLARRLIRYVNIRQLPQDYPVDQHFRPTYDPWDQRLCAARDGDFFRAIRTGHASVMTDQITTFTERGVLLESGHELDADVIVTATGLNLKPMGGLSLTVDRRPINLADTIVFRGIMLSGVPNFSFTIGYTNASWTLKIGLLCDRIFRLLAHMDKYGYGICHPDITDYTMGTRPLFDFPAGYVQRSVAHLPRQGEHAPWRMPSSHYEDVTVLRSDLIHDDHMRLRRACHERMGRESRSADTHLST